MAIGIGLEDARPVYRDDDCLCAQESTILKLYVVRNKEGKYFRAKGYGGYGQTWVDELVKARIYANIQGARGVVSWFAKAYPQFGTPELIQLNVGSLTVIDEAERISKALKRKELAAERSRKRQAERRMKEAEAEFKRAQARLESLKSGK